MKATTREAARKNGLWGVVALLLGCASETAAGGAPGAGASDGDTDSEVGLDSPEGAGQLARRVCVESSTAPESYSVATQADVDALEGCSEIQGSLDLGLSAPVDLRPLAQLRRVHGRLSISSRLDSSQPIVEQSLVGLEALEEVHSLALGHPGITSLEPLRVLRRAQHPDPEAPGQGLQLSGIDIEDLEGLENLSEVQQVNIDGAPRLVSLRGLSLPSEMAEVRINALNLADLSALAGVVSVRDSLWLSSAVEHLDELSSLRSARYLHLAFNERLRNADGLSGLTSILDLHIYDAPSLAALPEFSSLASVNHLEISQLPSLAGSLSLPALTNANILGISDNSALSRVNLPALKSVGTLLVTGNAVLQALDVSSLERAPMVKVFGNPLLADPVVSSLADLRVAKVGNNSSPFELLASCPWPGDFECDEVGFRGSALCASGTDTFDCSQTID